MKLLQPQEIEVYYFIPAIRSNLAMEMKKLGKSQKEIADLLQIQESTVSQYMSEKRGVLEFSKEIIAQIRGSALNIKTRMEALEEIQRILMLLRRNGFLCEIHKKHSDVPQDCSMEKVCCK